MTFDRFRDGFVSILAKTIDAMETTEEPSEISEFSSFGMFLNPPLDGWLKGVCIIFPKLGMIFKKMCIKISKN